MQSRSIMLNQGGDTIRERLEARRLGLLHRYRTTLDRVEEELADHSADFLDTAAEQWDARVLDLVSESDAVTLEQIVGALHRLDDGTYGTCAACEQAIAPARLAIVPEVRLCAPCAREAEQHTSRMLHEVA